MPTIITRAGKSATLTHNELDANFNRTVRQVTTTDTVLGSDNCNLIQGNHASTPFTVTMITVALAAAEDPEGFETSFFNIGAAVMSIDGDSTETINGSTDLITLKQYDGVTLKLNSAGDGWNTIARVGDLGAIDATTVTASGDTSAGDNATIGYTAAEGLILTGQGSTNDVTVKNDADAEVAGVLTGTTNVHFNGTAIVGEAVAATAVFQVNDNATSKDLLTGILSDNNAPWHLAIQNEQYSTTLIEGLRLQVTNDGSSEIYAADDGVTPADLVLRTDAAAALTLDGSTQAATFSNDVSIDGTTDTSSGTTGSIHTDGGLGVAKKVYVGTGLTVAGDITYDSIVQPKVKIVDIGDWNMDSTASVNVAHGLTLANIRDVTALIRRDDDATHIPINWGNAAASPSGGVSVNATNATLTRVASGLFDSTSFDSTSFNRGWVTITYV